MFDAHGDRLGLYMGRDDDSTSDAGGDLRQVVVLLDNLAVIARIDARDGDIATNNTLLLFEQAHCQGAAFSRKATALLRPNAAGNDRYFITGAEPRTITVRSQGRLPDPDLCRDLDPREVVAVAAEPIVPAELGLDLPIATPLIVGVQASNP